MSHRFYVEPPITGDEATLAGPEAHHLIHVMRARVGDEITLFDGSGSEFRASVLSLSRQTVGAEILSREEIDRELAFRLTLAVALPKGDRQKMLVEKATELGVARLVPLSTERGVAQPTGSAIERLRRGAIEACKQCGRNRLLEIEEPQTLATFLARQEPNTLRLLAHPSGAPVQAITWSEASQASELSAPRDCELLIGPEGGFSDAEASAAVEAGATSISLGPRILRIETAAIALAAIAAVSLSR